MEFIPVFKEMKEDKDRLEMLSPNTNHKCDQHRNSSLGRWGSGGVGGCTVFKKTHSYYQKKC